MPALVFGFEPFLEFDENPSQIVAQSLDGRVLGGERVTGVVLPVDYSRVERDIVRAIERVGPDLAVGFGLAQGRERITPEKIAMNYRSADKPDNAGRLVTGTPIDKHQPDGIFSQLPVERLVTSLNSIGIPASLSFNAGAYLCNNAMFIIVREARKRGFAGGFVHLPCHTEWVARRNSKSPSLPIGLIQSAAEHCVTYSLRTLKRNRS